MLDAVYLDKVATESTDAVNFILTIFNNSEKLSNYNRARNALASLQDSEESVENEFDIVIETGNPKTIYEYIARKDPLAILQNLDTNKLDKVSTAFIVFCCVRAIIKNCTKLTDIDNLLFFISNRHPLEQIVIYCVSLCTTELEPQIATKFFERVKHEFKFRSCSTELLSLIRATIPFNDKELDDEISKRIESMATLGKSLLLVIPYTEPPSEAKEFLEITSQQTLEERARVIGYKSNNIVRAIEGYEHILSSVSDDFLRTEEDYKKFKDMTSEVTNGLDAVPEPSWKFYWETISSSENDFFKAMQNEENRIDFCKWYEYQTDSNKPLQPRTKLYYLIFSNSQDIENDSKNLKDALLEESKLNLKKYIEDCVKRIRESQVNFRGSPTIQFYNALIDYFENLDFNNNFTLSSVIRGIEHIETLTLKPEDRLGVFDKNLEELKEELKTASELNVDKFGLFLEEALVFSNLDILKLKDISSSKLNSLLFMDPNDPNLSEFKGVNETYRGDSYPVLFILDLDISDEKLTLLKKQVLLLINYYVKGDGGKEPSSGNFFSVLLLELAYELGVLDNAEIQTKLTLFKSNVLNIFYEHCNKSHTKPSFEVLVEVGSSFAVFTENKEFWLKAINGHEQKQSQESLATNTNEKEGGVFYFPSIKTFARFIPTMDKGVRDSRYLVTQGMGTSAISSNPNINGSSLGPRGKVAMERYVKNRAIKSEGRNVVRNTSLEFQEAVNAYSRNALDQPKQEATLQEKELLKERLNSIILFFRATTYGKYPKFFNEIVNLSTNEQSESSESDYKLKLDSLDLSNKPIFYWLIKLSDEEFMPKFIGQAKENLAEFVLLLDVVMFSLFKELNLGSVEMMLEVIKLQKLAELESENSKELINNLQISDRPLDPTNLLVAASNTINKLSSTQLTPEQSLLIEIDRLIEAYKTSTNIVKRQGKDFKDSIDALIRRFKYVKIEIPYDQRAETEGKDLNLRRDQALDRLNTIKERKLRSLENEATQIRMDIKRKERFSKLKLFPSVIPIIITLLILFGTRTEDDILTLDNMAGINLDPQAQITNSIQSDIDQATAAPIEGVSTSSNVDESLPLPDELTLEQINKLPDVIFFEQVLDNTEIQGMELISGMVDSSVMPNAALRNDSELLVSIDSDSTQDEAFAEINKAAEQYSIRAYKRNMSPFIMPSNWNLEIKAIYTFGRKLTDVRLNVFGGIIIKDPIDMNDIIIVVEQVRKNAVEQITPQIRLVRDIKLNTLPSGPVPADFTDLLPIGTQSSYTQMAQLRESNAPIEQLYQPTVDLLTNFAPFFNSMPYTLGGFTSEGLEGLTDMEVLTKMLSYIYTRGTNCAGAGSSVSGLFDSLNYQNFKLGLNPLISQEDPVTHKIFGVGKVGHTQTAIPTAEGLLIIDFTPSSVNPAVIAAVTPSLPETDSNTDATGTLINPLENIFQRESYDALEFIQKHFKEFLGVGTLISLALSIYLISRLRKKAKLNNDLISKVEEEIATTIIKSVEVPPIINSSITKVIASNIPEPIEDVEQQPEQERKLSYFESEFLSAILFIIALGDFVDSDVESKIDTIIKILATADIRNYEQDVKEYLASEQTREEFINSGNSDAKIVVAIGEIFREGINLLKQKTNLPSSTAHLFNGADNQQEFLSVYTAQELNLMASTLIKQIYVSDEMELEEQALDQKISMSKTRIREIVLSKFSQLESNLSKDNKNYLLAYFIREVLS